MGYEVRRYSYSVAPYSPEWRKVYVWEAARIKGTLGEELLYLEHAGGTAIAGCAARPVVDIIAVVKNLDALDSYESAFHAIGYDPLDPETIIGARCFKKDSVCPRGGWERVADLFIFPDEHPKMMAMIAVRDYLLAHPDEARKFEEAKKKLFQKYPNDHVAYHEEKQSLLRELARRAARAQGSNVHEDWGTV